MRLWEQRIKDLCRRKGTTLEKLLHRARVSRTAYYSLIRRENLLPKTIRRLAGALEVAPHRLLQSEESPEQKIQRLRLALERIMKKHPKASAENVWHTLILLEAHPIDRLRRGLIRGQKNNFLG